MKETFDKTEKTLPEAELCVMQVLWSAEREMGAGEIAKALETEKGWKKATVHVILTRLCERGYLDADRSGYVHKFWPLVSEAEYNAVESRSFLRRLRGMSAKHFIASMIESEELSDGDLVELEEILKRKRGRDG